jgi:hypothetical protein
VPVSNTHDEVLKALEAGAEYVNPAIAMAAEFQMAETRGDLELIESAIRSGAVEKAIAAGEEEGRAVLKSLHSCGHAPPIASKVVPVGF